MQVTVTLNRDTDTLHFYLFAPYPVHLAVYVTGQIFRPFFINCRIIWSLNPASIMYTQTGTSADMQGTGTDIYRIVCICKH
jgi:hypothetical protein